MSKILIVYGTTHGQTAKISRFIAAHLESMNHYVEVVDSSKIQKGLEVKNYDGIIVGASVYANSFQRSLKKWVKRNAIEMNQKKSAFFSVCLGILQKESKVQKEEWQFVHDFLQKNKWSPQIREIFAGSLPYSKYNWLIKYVMKKISKKAGGDTDTSRDYEYTDWLSVARFATEFDGLMSVDVSTQPKIIPMPELEANNQLSEILFERDW